MSAPFSGRMAFWTQGGSVEPYLPKVPGPPRETVQRLSPLSSLSPKVVRGSYDKCRRNSNWQEGKPALDFVSKVSEG